MFTLNIRMGTNIISDFNRVMNVNAKWTGLSVSEIVDLLGFSHTTVNHSTVYPEWCAINLSDMSVGGNALLIRKVREKNLYIGLSC